MFSNRTFNKSNWIVLKSFWNKTLNHFFFATFGRNGSYYFSFLSRTVCPSSSTLWMLGLALVTSTHLAVHCLARLCLGKIGTTSQTSCSQEPGFSHVMKLACCQSLPPHHSCQHMAFRIDVGIESPAPCGVMSRQEDAIENSHAKPSLCCVPSLARFLESALTLLDFICPSGIS